MINHETGNIKIILNIIDNTFGFASMETENLHLENCFYLEVATQKSF